MDYKVVYFRFNKQLSEEQENTFIAIFQNVVNSAKRRVSDGKKLINNKVAAMLTNQLGNSMLDQLDYLENNMLDFVKLTKDKIAPNTYMFLVAYKNFEFLDIEFLGHRQNYWEKLQKRILKDFQSEGLKRMGLTKEDCNISFGETKA
jgi:hypothetical protein